MTAFLYRIIHHYFIFIILFSRKFIAYEIREVIYINKFP